MTDTRPHPTLPRSLQPHAGAPEESTWSTRSAASMNDVDTDNHRHTMGNEEGPDHRHNAAFRAPPADLPWMEPVPVTDRVPVRDGAAGSEIRQSMRSGGL